MCENSEEARRLIEGKLDGRSTLNLQLTTKGELYGHLAQHERNVSRVEVLAWPIPREIKYWYPEFGFYSGLAAILSILCRMVPGAFGLSAWGGLQWSWLRCNVRPPLA